MHTSLDATDVRMESCPGTAAMLPKREHGTRRCCAQANSSLPTSHRPLTTRSRSERLAFTLTELLVVIAIIAVLAAMTSVGVMRALDTAKQTRIKTEVDQLDAAFKAYREKYGSLPPCDLTTINDVAIKAHIARAFPRYNIATDFTADLLQVGVDRANFRPDQAIVFWLQGFSPDPAHPFVTPAGLQLTSGSAGVKVQLTPLFDFDKSRLAAVPGSGTSTITSYFPQGSKTDATGAPYLYWEPGPITTTGGMTITVTSKYGTVATTSGVVTLTPAQFNSVTPIFLSAGVAVPYWSDITNPGTADPTENWAQIDSFQIIAAGGDNKYGGQAATIPRLYPTGTGYDVMEGLRDNDNVTNFCPKSRLGDAKP